ncbi:MAG: DUF4337 domain-containing protein [Steroidobacterales bacterium]
MAEVEIHAAQTHGEDPFGHTVGILVGIIGVLLSVVTILGHREHTYSVVHKTEANDQWAYYQAKKIREHTEGVGMELLNSLPTDPNTGAAAAARFEQNQARYASDAAKIQKEAEARDAESQRSERRALRFDLGEGFLELGLVMSSLYFLARRRFFVGMGVTAAVIGSIIGVAGIFS